MPDVKNWNGHSGEVLDSVQGFDVIECQKCGFKHIVPLPSLEKLENVYRDEYYSAEKPLYIERSQEDLDWWNLTYSERYDIFEEILPHGRRRILDVGSGPGFFLLHGKKRGWETLGIEPSSQAVSHSRDLGLNIIEDFLTRQTARKLGKFDVLHMSDVLEHIPDPREMLQISKRLLSSGGLICVVVPNDYNPFQSALRKGCGFDPWWVAPPHHINYLNFDSMSQLLRDEGFEVILSEATFPMELFLLMGDDYVGNDSLGRECHAKRMRVEQNLTRAGMAGLKNRLYQAFGALGIGREVQIVGRKNPCDEELES